MPISVNAVGKPSMIATTTSDSISSPRLPLVMLPHGVKMIVAPRMSPMMVRPKYSSLRMI